MGFFGFNGDVGIDLGTASVLVFIKGKGIVLREPSVVAIDKNNNRVLAVGDEAKCMIGRTPGNIVAKRPLRNGVISDYDITEKMLKDFLRKAYGTRNWGKPRLVVCVPCEATEVERRAVRDAALSAGARKVYLVEEPIAAALGAGLDISRPSGLAVVDIGGGTTDVAIISLSGMVVRSSIAVAGDKFDEAIIKYIRRQYKMMIGERTAENIKIEIGCAFKRPEDASMEVKGRDLVTGLPKNLLVSSEEIRGALSEPLNDIAECVHAVLEKTPPELSSDISSSGILMTGGGSLLYGFDQFIESKTKVPVKVADDPVSCVALGAGKAVENLDLLDDLTAEAY